MQKYLKKIKLKSSQNNIINEIIDKNNKKLKHLIFFNTHSYIESLKNNLFMRSILNSNYVFADGIGIFISSYFFKDKKPERITGYDFFEKLLNKINSENTKIKLFFLGGEMSNLDKLREQISSRFKNIKKNYIEVLSPPFGKDFNFHDENIIREINSFKPDIIFVGLGAPKQEKWVYMNTKKIDCVNFLSIGAAFNFFTGLEKRAPQVLRKYGFEWLFRLTINPKKIFKRVFISGGIFIYLFLVSLFLKKNFYNLKQIKLNINLIKNFDNFDWKQGYILSALNLASLSFLYKGDINLSKNLFFWGDGIFHKVMIKNSKKIAGRQLINLIKTSEDVVKLHVIGNLTIKTKTYLENKFNNLKLINSKLPYGDINEIIYKLPMVKEDELIFLTLPTPKQEQVADFYHKRNINLKIVCIGGGLAIAAGDEKEVPKVFDFFGLEWLWRLRYETKRRLKRLLISACYMFKYIFYGRFFKKIIVKNH